MSFTRCCSARSADALTSAMDCAELEMMSSMTFELLLTLTPTRLSLWRSNIVYDIAPREATRKTELIQFNCNPQAATTTEPLASR